MWNLHARQDQGHSQITLSVWALIAVVELMIEVLMAPNFLTMPKLFLFSLLSKLHQLISGSTQTSLLQLTKFDFEREISQPLQKSATVDESKVCAQTCSKTAATNSLAVMDFKSAAVVAQDRKAGAILVIRCQKEQASAGTELVVRNPFPNSTTI